MLKIREKTEQKSSISQKKERHSPETPDTVTGEDRGSSDVNIGEAEQGLRRHERNKDWVDIL